MKKIYCLLTLLLTVLPCFGEFYPDKVPPRKITINTGDKLVIAEKAKDLEIVVAADALPITVFAAENLGDIIEILSAPDSASSKIPPKSIYIPRTHWEFDFADVKGQALAKKGLEIAAAGGHNAIVMGYVYTGPFFIFVKNRLWI